MTWPAPGRGDALALAHFVRDAVAAGAEREALHLRLSRLAPQLRLGHHQRLLEEALAPVLRPARSRLFSLPNGDLVAVSPPQGAHLQQAQRVLSTLLGAGVGAALLALPRDAVALMAAVEDALGLGAWPSAPDEAEAAGFFGPAELAGLERALQGASLARFLRRSPVCRLDPGGAASFAWEDWRLAWPELRAALFDGADPAAAPWLRRRLRRMAERRMLAELAAPEEVRRRGPIGLSLAAGTLEQEAFLRFDALLSAGQRARTVVALPVEDLLADAEGFGFARALLRARGYRVALDLAEPGQLGLLSAEALGEDLLRLRWSPALPATASLLPAKREQVVLTGANRAAVIGWGWEQGITLFEGRLLTLLREGE